MKKRIMKCKNTFLNRKTSSLLVIILSTICATKSLADILKLNNAIELAKSLSPELRSLYNQVESAEARGRQALAPSEPTLSISYNDLDKSFNVPNSGSTVYQITQPIAFPGKALVNHSAIAHQAQSIFYLLKAKELDVAHSVKTAYFNLILAKRNIELNSETKSSYERILAIAKRRYEAGAITQVDLLNAEIALYSSENDLADLESAEKIARGMLNSYIGRGADFPTAIESLDSVRRSPMPEINISDAQNTMLFHRPEIKSASEVLEAANKSYALAKMSLLPDFQLTLGTTKYNLLAANPVSSGMFPSGSPDGSPNYSSQTYMVGIQASIPLWGLFNEKEAISAAAHDRAAAESNLSTLHIQSNLAIQSAIESLKTLNTKILNYENHLLGLSEQSLRIALASYSSGKIDFQTLADSAAARRQIRHDYYGLIVNYLTSFSAYGQLLGEELQ
jgi:cobalt-zinc-cadmium efflux system outer membrane protein